MGGMVVQRASLNDLTELATETATGPQQIAAILRLEAAISCSMVRQALAQRLAGVPRLRQRLMPTAVGLGRPIWVDYADFDFGRHVQEEVCPDPSSEATALQVAAAAAVDPLPRDRPFWRLTLILDSAGACHSLILVVHHVLADGIGGLAALVELVDHTTAESTSSFPTPAPSRSELLRDVTASRLHRLRSLPAAAGQLRMAMSELQGGQAQNRGHRRRPPRCSLNQPISRRRQLATARVNLSDAIATAHRHNATVNDVLLAAVAGALAATVRGRGESLDRFVISVPVSARQTATTAQLGNQVGVIPVTVPATSEPIHRLQGIGGITRSGVHRQGRGSSAAVLGRAFRLLGRIGIFGWFINHQRLVNTFLTNMRGPQQPLYFLGSKITDIIAISPIAGNVTVAFAALSYAGRITVTIIADPETCPDLQPLAAVLQQQLDDLTAGIV
jgi:diacylglycerol O-acyltransferase / wax synthase